MTGIFHLSRTQNNDKNKTTKQIHKYCLHGSQTDLLRYHSLIFNNKLWKTKTVTLMCANNNNNNALQDFLNENVQQK